MQVADYLVEELQFAYAYHAFVHWRTHRRKPHPPLTELDQSSLHALVEPLGLHVLECDNRPTECRVLVSLRPTEPLSNCASKLKGRVSKWLRERLRLESSTALLARGYFACTSGATTSERVEAYLDAQGDHHGYNRRVLPPVFVSTYHPDRESRPWWHAEHACTHLQFHVVLATAGRRGIFGADEAAAVAASWAEIQPAGRFALRKVSFVPDHVHVAIWLHPAASPSQVVLALMNQAQRLMAARFLPRIRTCGIGPPLATQRVHRQLWRSGDSAGAGLYPALANVGALADVGVATHRTIPGPRPGACCRAAAL